MQDDEALRQSFFLHATVAFGDACTRPKLTPNCPYYRETDTGPTCGEQCRSLAESLGDTSRKVTQHKVGGLILTGREIPRSAAAGIEGFDAGRIYLEERHLPLSDQSTPALLLNLRHHMINIVIDGDGEREQPAEIYRELVNRNFPAARATAAGLSLPLARAAVSRATFSRLTETGLIGTVGMGAFSQNDPWHEFLDAVQKSSPAADLNSLRNRSHGPYPGLVLPSWLADLNQDGALVEAIESDEILSFAFSPDFVYRLSQWFGRVLNDDAERVFQGSLPDHHLFLGLDRSPYSDDPAEWVWTRLTQTSLNSWSQSALVHEWNWQARDENHGFQRRILRERVIDSDLVARTCLGRLSSGAATPANQGFDPSDFVTRAIGLLQDGHARAAANIFSGITELRPTDADAWNNLGFCQIPFDPAGAIQSFGKSAMFSREGNRLRLVNQILALHLLGLDQDALLLATEASGLRVPSGQIWLWRHSSGQQAGAPEPVSNVGEYLDELLNHIRAGQCVCPTPPSDA